LREAIKKALDKLGLEAKQLNEFLFGTPSSELMDKSIQTLFPANDIREKTELNPRDVRACLYLKLIGKWYCEAFGEVADEFMHLQISRGRMGRMELTTVLTLANLLENFPKEVTSKLILGKGEAKNGEKKD